MYLLAIVQNVCVLLLTLYERPRGCVGPVGCMVMFFSFVSWVENVPEIIHDLLEE